MSHNNSPQQGFGNDPSGQTASVNDSDQNQRPPQQNNQNGFGGPSQNVVHSSKPAPIPNKALVGPFTARDLLVIILGFVPLILSILPFDGGVLWAKSFPASLGVNFVMVLFPAVVSILFILRRIQPYNQRFQSIAGFGLDQIAAVVAFFSALLWIFSLVRVVSYVTVLGAVMGIGYFVVAACGQYIPALRGDFYVRPDQPAVPAARVLPPAVHIPKHPQQTGNFNNGGYMSAPAQQQSSEGNSGQNTGFMNNQNSRTQHEGQDSQNSSYPQGQNNPAVFQENNHTPEGGIFDQNRGGGPDLREQNDPNLTNNYPVSQTQNLEMFQGSAPGHQNGNFLEERDISASPGLQGSLMIKVRDGIYYLPDDPQYPRIDPQHTFDSIPAVEAAGFKFSKTLDNNFPSTQNQFSTVSDNSESSGQISSNESQQSSSGRTDASQKGTKQHQEPEQTHTERKVAGEQKQAEHKEERDQAREVKKSSSESTSEDASHAASTSRNSNVSSSSSRVASEMFWFAVPAPIDLSDMETAEGFQLKPGVWYLALEDRGDHLIVSDRTTDTPAEVQVRKAILKDRNNIERG